MASRRRSAAGGFEMVGLHWRDVGEVFELYLHVRSRSPYGHLAIRTFEDFDGLLRNPANASGTGIRIDGRLVAYSLCHRLAANPYGGSPLLSALDPAATSAFHGDGTVVHPDYRNSHLARRLFELRRRQMKDRQIDHMLYLVAVDNLASLVALFPGVIVVGLAPDETAMNFIAYCGRLQTNVASEVVPIPVDWRDIDQQRRLFDEGWVADGLGRPSDAAAGTDGYRFAFVPIACRRR